MEPKDQQDRLSAALPAGFNIIVEAGAGTGKTTLLTDRLCYLVLGKDIPIDKIIALTFTEKAAAEIKIRLLAKMQKIVSDLDKETDREPAADILLTHFGKTKEQLRAAVQTSFELAERAQISTIHSFCLQILRKYPLEAELAPKCQADDGTIAQGIFDKQWGAFLEQQLTFDSAAQHTWRELLACFSLEELKDFAFTLLTPALSDYHPFNNLEAVQNYCRACAQEAQELAQRYLSGKPRDIETSLQLAAKHLLLGADILSAESEKEFGEDIKVPSSTPPKNWPKEDFLRAKELIVFANNFTPKKQKLIMKAFNIFTPLRQNIREEIRKENIISYDDLIYKTRDLLKKSKTVREEMKKDYQSILIDEFQDTDPAQGEILVFLAERKGDFAPNWHSVALEQGKLFVVGDPKQSIYRFRGADINAYEKFTDLMARQGAKRCFLKTNFRSLPNIIAFANSFGGKAITEHKGVQPAYIAIEAGRAQSGPKVQITAVDGGEEKAGIDTYRQNQAQYIAAWVKDNVYKTKLADGKVMTYKDIALLVRSTSALDIYIDALKRFDIKYTVEETKNFYTAQEVLDIINILKLLSDPKDKTALLGVLRSPFALLSDAEILNLYRKDALNIFAQVQDMPRVGEIYKLLRQLHFKAGRLPLEALINEIVYNTDFLTLQTLAAQKEQAIANIFKFVSLTRKMHAQGALNLGQFLFYAQKYAKEQNKEGQSPLAEESLDTLSLMTMHKSKGLEFPVVILADLSRKETDRTDKKPLYLNNWYSGAAGIRLGSLQDGNFALLEQANKAHAKAEEMRILYVALTRAKEHLLLVGDLKDEQTALAGALQSAGCYPGAEIKPQQLEGRQDIAELTYLPCLAPEVLAQQGEAQQQTEAEGFNLIPWREAWQKRCQTYTNIIQQTPALSPSAQGEHQQNFAPAAVQQQAVTLGRLCHQLLFGVFTEQPFTPLRAAQMQGIDPQENSELLEAAQKIVDSFAQSAAFKNLKEMTLLAAEMPFCMHGTDGRTINGIMDAVFATKEGGIFIADYKSDNIKEDALEQKAAAYAPQLAVYKQAAKEIFKDKDISAGVVFLRPALIKKV